MKIYTFSTLKKEYSAETGHGNTVSEFQDNIPAASMKAMLLRKIYQSIVLFFSFQPKGKKVLRNLSYVLCQVEVLAFLFAFLMAGILWGYLENFLFWHLEDLGATKFLMGTYWKIYYLSKSDHFLNLNVHIFAKVKHCCRLKSILVGVAEFSSLQQVHIYVRKCCRKISLKF